MKTIGLIGGMSWESTLTYYRYINEEVRARMGGLVSAKILLNSLDFSEVVHLQQQGKWDDAGDLLADAAAGLQDSGADCILICTNTMHLVARQVANAANNIPLIDIIEETAKSLVVEGHQKVLLLATKYTMEQGFYHQQMARAGISIAVPEHSDRLRLQQIIFDELCCGTISAQSRNDVIRMTEDAKRSGVTAVILGCTEIQLLVSPDEMPLPGFDSTRIHAEAAIDYALSDKHDGKSSEQSVEKFRRHSV